MKSTIFKKSSWIIELLGFFLILRKIIFYTKIYKKRLFVKYIVLQ